MNDNPSTYRVLTARTLVPLSLVTALAGGAVAMIPLALSLGADRAAFNARVNELEKSDEQRDRRLDLLADRLTDMERSLWRIEGRLGTRPDTGTGP